MDPVQSQLDGRMYDSKSALRATYRATGVTEVGNDPVRLRKFKRKPIEDKSIVDVAFRQGYAEPLAAEDVNISIAAW
ncbi:hypothetical protein [Bradyrhizobium sp. 170]|uniref:hypothetical protein n=1 Tax=Bradyrhizobium sp. 170 TaxID=2782641 RepID=UPI002000068B|nr:hypothetical protein [Bradyrhizobium sp. 170]UPK02389.1 hypothetical protein IVB05_33090 [Bradyrhizobium sp. 170]